MVAGVSKNRNRKFLVYKAPAVKHHYSGLELYSGKQKYPTLMHFLMSAHVSGKFYSTCTLEKAINQYTSTAIPYHSQKPNASQVC